MVKDHLTRTKFVRFKIQKYKNWARYFVSQIWTVKDIFYNKGSIDASWKNESNDSLFKGLAPIVSKCDPKYKKSWLGQYFKNYSFKNVVLTWSSQSHGWRYLCFRGLFRLLLMVPFDRTMVIFDEKLVFWHVSSAGRSPDTWFGLFCLDFRTLISKYTVSGNFADKYEIDRLF